MRHIVPAGAFALLVSAAAATGAGSASAGAPGFAGSGSEAMPVRSSTAGAEGGGVGQGHAPVEEVVVKLPPPAPPERPPARGSSHKQRPARLVEEPVRWLAGKVASLVRRATPRPRPHRPRGPFHPVLGAGDYGEAQARFGASRSGRMHEGQDVFAPSGTPLLAVRDAIVLESGSDGSRGNYLALFSPAANRTYVYLHMLAPAPVGAGERVRAGQQVGQLGCTGSCFGEHLHFEVHEGQGAGGVAEDPLPLLLSWRVLGG